jgi:hypothetical protein
LQELSCIKTNLLKAFYLTLIILFSFSKNFSQTWYTADANYLRSKTEQNNVLSSFKKDYPDTSVANLHQFFPRNFMGNFGLPNPNYILRYNSDDPGFRLYPNVYFNDQFHENEIKYFQSKGPFAEVTGIAGSQQLQALKLIFTQTIKKRLNITLRFNRYSSLGFYKHQQSFTNNFYLSSNYTNKKSRAGYYFFLLNNSNKNQENGGIKGDTLTATTFTTNKATLLYKISSANRDNREYKVMLNPWYRLNSGSDSSSSFNSYIQVKSKLCIASYKYKDDAPANDQFYTLYYLDTVRTKDSTHVLQLINDVYYSGVSANKNFGFAAGYRDERNDVRQHNDSVFSNSIALGRLNVRVPLKKDSANNVTSDVTDYVSAEYIVNGVYSGNYKLENSTAFTFGHKTIKRVYLKLMAENRNPDYIYNYWVSNHFTWLNNGYQAQQTQQALLGFEWGKRASVSVLAQNINHYLFFDYVAQPGQLNGSVQNIAVTASYSMTLFRHLGIYVQNVFQSTSTNFISIPQEIITARLFYTGNLRNNNLQLNFGVQGQAYQSFYPYAYMPATQAFYLQDRATTGNYPYVDLYLNARIRPVTFFVKVENVLYRFAGKNYSLVPGYYQADLALRFGISWMFFD